MIPLLVWHKRFAAKKAAELTPARVAQALAEREAAWTHGEARFAGAISYVSAVKSLKAIARDHPALRPHFRMAPAQGLAPAEADPPAELDYDAAARCRDRGLLVTTAIRLTLDPEDAGVASTLDLVTTILAACPPKPYKYALYVTLSGVDFGPGTLRTLPVEDLLARERLAARLPLLARMSLGAQARSAIVIGYAAANVELAARCLLQEVGDAAAMAKAAVPPRFVEVMTSLAAMKPRELRRHAVVPLADLERQAAQAPSPGEFAPRVQDLAPEAEDRMRALAESGALPHRLEASGELASAPEKFDRRTVLDSALLPLGYERVPQPAGSVGFHVYTKPAQDGETIELMLDFGTWRQSVFATFIFIAGPIAGLAANRFNVRYRCWPRNTDVPITTEALFRQTFDNVAALTTMLEREYVPRFRALLAQARA